MDPDERLRTAELILDRARRRVEALGEPPEEGEELRAFLQIMFEQGRQAGLIEAASVVLGGTT